MIEPDFDEASVEVAEIVRPSRPASRLLPMLIGLQIVLSLCVYASLFPTRPTVVATSVAPMPTVPRAPAVLLPPPVAPMAVMDIAPDTARSLNAAVPIDPAPLRPARPFVLAGSADDRANALACLAAAELYEAGDDKIGEQAVAQVVLNRVRHPAFPKTVCGVVFQGSERTTGCQFTFTCDGSLARPVSPAAWKRAQALADAALSGAVLKEVGTATHYHTDWVVPYWRDSLDKIAIIHAHIFYRWQGWWGTPPAFSGQYQPPEQIDSRIASLSTAQPAVANAPAPESGTVPPPATHEATPVLPRNLVAEGVAPEDLHGNAIRLMDAKAGRYALLLDPAAYPGSYAIVAFALCRVRPSCEVMGWTREDMLPTVLPPASANLSMMAFRFTKANLGDRGEARWNCRLIRREHADQCLPGTDSAVVRMSSPPPPVLAAGKAGQPQP